MSWQSPSCCPRARRSAASAHYDNSPENIANPNPNRIVHWGEQTWDEMLMGFMDTTDPEPSVTPPARTSADSEVSLRARRQEQERRVNSPPPAAYLLTSSETSAAPGRT